MKRLEDLSFWEKLSEKEQRELYFFTGHAPPGFLTVREAAERYGRSRSTIRKALERGVVYGFRVDGMWYFPRDEGDAHWTPVTSRPEA